ncbi:hypothetical protein D9M71_500980 [compost metagenome]
MDLGDYQPTDVDRAPHLVITEIERLVAVRHSGLVDALVEGGQRVGHVAVGPGEVVGLLVASAADEQSERPVFGA